MVITIEMLKEKNASADLLEWFSYRNLDGKDISEACKAAMEDDKFCHANLLIRQFLDRIDKIRCL
jgi:hypothetical protein